MEGGVNDVSSTVGNQSLDSREPQQTQEISHSDRQISQQPILNQSTIENRSMEIPAAKVNTYIHTL